MGNVFFKRKIFLGAKNIPGWKTNRKIVVFSVDDYGNVRLHSRRARENMDRAGLKILSRFDALDTLETRTDLELLFEALTSVTDMHGKPAVFTPFAVPCNIDFEKIESEQLLRYQYELLPVTFQKLSCLEPEAYDGTWSLWQEGISRGIFMPQFHGREHLNLRIFEEKLEKKDHNLLTALKNRSYTSISDTGYPTISYTGAYQFWDIKDNEHFELIITDGFRAFENVFGYQPSHFNAPGGYEHTVLHKTIHQSGGKYIDTPWIKKEHQGHGKYRYSFNYTGKRNNFGMIFLLRNVVFEPSDERGFDWSEYALKQIEVAFSLKKPAVISSHRINFCGHIEERNREKGIIELKRFLKKIVTRWPDVEFMSSHQLLSLIENE